MTDLHTKPAGLIITDRTDSSVAKKVVSLTSEVVYVGRSSQCAIVLGHDSISRVHGCFEFVDNDWFYTDKSSTQGSLVNHVPIDSTCKLRHGDQVLIGGYTLKFFYNDDPDKVLITERMHFNLHDELTNVYNRTYFFCAIEREVRSACRHKSPLGISLLDIDHFKKINDFYGFSIGDRILCQLARLLVNQLKDDDFIARYGGEEFVLVTPNKSQEQTHEVCEKLRLAVASHKFIGEPKEFIDVTISIGTTSLQKTDPDYFTAMRRADDALNEAKLAGRNCTKES